MKRVRDINGIMVEGVMVVFTVLWWRQCGIFTLLWCRELGMYLLYSGGGSGGYLL